ncbi:spore coat protein [Bacillus daqingensis]|uniref:Spore coat protein n=1 Tax=Bacillus daqingensis TaxID=872396 RepID=A0ABV9NY97_9BACI
MARHQYAPHEMIEVHEVLTLKTSALAKGYVMYDAAVNEELKELLQEGIDEGENAVKELQQLISQSN